jgi:NitT/TauT family transport system ATP-binding protein
VLTARTIAAMGALKQAHGGLAQPLPAASVSRISGLVGKLAEPLYGEAELGALAGSLALEVDDLFPVAAALHLLEFAELKDGILKLTAAGRVFADSGKDERKMLFREHLALCAAHGAYLSGAWRTRRPSGAARALRKSSWRII